MNLIPTLSTLSLIALCGVTHAQATAESIYRQAVKACNELKSAQFTVEASNASLKVKANVWQVNADVPDGGFAPGKYRVTGTADDDGSLSFFELAYDGFALQIKDNSDKVRVIQNPTPFQAGQYTPMPAIYVGLTVVGNALGRVLAEKPTLRLLPSKKVGNWTCDVIEVMQKVEHPVSGEVTLISRLAIDRKTHLPVQRATDRGAVTITKLILNPKIEDDMFRLDAKVVVEADPRGPGTEKLLAIGTIAPNFALKDAKGKVRKLEDYKGKVLVLDFWATWCMPCRKSMPILAALSKKGVAVLGVSIDREYDPVAYMKRLGYSYPIAIKGDSVSKEYKVELLPSVYVIGPDGRIVYRQAGINPDDATRLPQIVADASETQAAYRTSTSNFSLLISIGVPTSTQPKSHFAGFFPVSGNRIHPWDAGRRGTLG